jgi:hypothetical protein
VSPTGGCAYDLPMTTTDLVANIDTRLADAKQEIATLEQARAALTRNGRTGGPAPDKRASPGRRRGRPRRSPKVVPVGKLTGLLGTEGMTTRQLAQRTGGASDQILGLLKEQEASGQIRRSGTRAGTRWHLVTDEDRVAARAAELAKVSGRRA